jgi:hypothetical protein
VDLKSTVHERNGLYYTAHEGYGRKQTYGSENLTELKFSIGKFTYAKFEGIAMVFLVIQFMWNASLCYCLILEGSFDILRITHRYSDELQESQFVLCYPFLLGNQVARFACSLREAISYSVQIRSLYFSQGLTLARRSMCA